MRWCVHFSGIARRRHAAAAAGDQGAFGVSGLAYFLV
jgi:hypothetical protein